MENRIRDIRKRQKITQKEIAEKVKVTRQYVSLLEKSEIEPSLRVVQGIAESLGCCLYYVFDIDGTGRYECSYCKV